MSQSVFPFSGLPAEIRIKIYNYCTTACETAVRHRLALSDSEGRDERYDFSFDQKIVWTKIPSIAQSNHQYQQEYYNELLKTNPNHEVQLSYPQIHGYFRQPTSTTRGASDASLTIRLEKVSLNENPMAPCAYDDPVLAAKARHIGLQTGQIARAFPSITTLRVVVSGHRGFKLLGESGWRVKNTVFMYNLDHPTLTECYVLAPPDMSGWRWVKQSGKWGEMEEVGWDCELEDESLTM
jgi:hypothetical protein